MKISINGSKTDLIFGNVAGEENSILKFNNARLKTTEFITNLNDGEVLVRLRDKRYIVLQSIDLNFTN